MIWPRIVCRLGERLRRRLGDPEVHDLGDRLSSSSATRTLEGLDVAVDDALLVRVLDGVAHVEEEVEAPARGEGLRSQ
jgi:hypothetical protein